MSKSLLISLVVLLVVISTVSTPAAPEVENDAESVEQLLVQELRQKCIFGRLEKRVGTFVTIDGYWEFDRFTEPKGSYLYFIVLKIDNLQLPRPVRFRSSDVVFHSDALRDRFLKPYLSHPFPDNLLLRQIELRVYESIAHNGVPDNYLKESGQQQAAGWETFELNAKLNVVRGDFKDRGSGGTPD